MKYTRILNLASASLLVASCSPGFLDIKPDRQVVVPETVADCQTMLDNFNVMSSSSPHGIGIIGAGEYYITDAHHASFPIGPDLNYQKNAYTWEVTVYEGEETRTDWMLGYKRILQANVAIDVLMGLPVTEKESEGWATALGTALFHRAYNYFALAQLYCAVYDPQTASAALGLPLRVEADPTLKVKRSSLADTYTRICIDLAQAAELLPERANINIRPSRQAAYALFTRVMMQMGDYSAALEYGLRCLAIGDELIDFNDIDRGSSQPFPSWGIGNTEVLFYDRGDLQVRMNSTNATNMDTLLLASYPFNDLRLQTYFRIQSDRVIFKGGYDGGYAFNGLATDEVYLNAAECLARGNNLQQSLHYINKLLEKRYAKGTFVPYSSINQEEVMGIILEERKKELVMRGTRWPDIRRLNKEEQYRTTLRRVISGVEYVLEPGSPRWVWPIPVNVVNLGGYEQNAR